MEYRAKLNSLNGRSASFTLLDDLDYSEIKNHAVNGQIYAYVEFTDDTYITQAQRRQIYALFKDMEEYNGNPVDAWESKMKYDFMLDRDLHELPSFATNAMSKTMASEFIEYVILFCLNNKIPFKFQQYHLPQESTRVLYKLLMNRMCFCCGAHAQIAHYDEVGMGRDRTKIDHRKHRLMALCYKHHKEQHDIGLKEFMKLHIVTPIKLSHADLIELGLMSKKQVTKFQEE